MRREIITEATARTIAAAATTRITGWSRTVAPKNGPSPVRTAPTKVTVDNNVFVYSSSLSPAFSGR